MKLSRAVTIARQCFSTLSPRLARRAQMLTRAKHSSDLPLSKDCMELQVIPQESMCYNLAPSVLP